MQKAYLVMGKRTPVGSLLGSLKTFTGPQLASIAIKGVLADTKLAPSQIDQVIMGNVLSCGLGQNPARQAALLAGLDISIPCYNVNKVCASGLKTVTMATTDIWCGLSNTVVAGGFESMTNAPHFIRNMRTGVKFGDMIMNDSVSHDGLTDAYNKKAMGFCGEKTAKEMGFTREQQDEYCISSYERCLQANERNLFEKEIVEVDVPKVGKLIADDEPMKYNKAKIPNLRPAFPDSNQKGTITGANASKINDGACALLLMSEKKLKESGLQAYAEVMAFADAETNPDDFNICPTLAAQKALKNAGLSVKDVDFWEINEAFSVTALANIKLLDIDRNKVNVHGGAVALGHPIGMSGARILLSLMNVLRTYNGKYGVATICNGGGGATAIVIKNVN